MILRSPDAAALLDLGLLCFRLLLLGLLLFGLFPLGLLLSSFVSIVLLSFLLSFFLSLADFFKLL